MGMTSLEIHVYLILTIFRVQGKHKGKRHEFLPNSLSLTFCVQPVRSDLQEEEIKEVKGTLRVVNMHFWNQHIKIVLKSELTVFYCQMPTLIVTCTFCKIDP